MVRNEESREAVAPHRSFYRECLNTCPAYRSIDFLMMLERYGWHIANGRGVMVHNAARVCDLRCNFLVTSLLLRRLIFAVQSGRCSVPCVPVCVCCAPMGMSADGCCSSIALSERYVAVCATLSSTTFSNAATL